MLDRKGIGKRLLRRNGILTVSCLLSVVIGTMLMVEMFNLSFGATKAYEKEMKSLYGDCDVAIFYEDYAWIDGGTKEQIIHLDSVEESATLIYSGDLMINGTNPYAIGTDNSPIVQSRYHFSSQLGPNEVAVNRIFAGVYGYETGSVIQAGDQELEVVEIFDDETLSESGVEMLVADQETLSRLGAGGGDINIILLRLTDVKESHIENEVRGIDGSLHVLIFGMDEDYLKSINSFRLFVMIVAACVILATALFTATVFRYFVYKYRRDMAVLRMAGATPKQVNAIFLSMTRFLTISGTIGGLVGALLFHSLFMEEVNRKLNLIQGDVGFLFPESFCISILIGLLIHMVLSLTIRLAGRILPMEALRENVKSRSGRLRKSRRIDYHFRDLFVSWKLMESRLRENSLMIATISVLVAVSILGPSLSNIIKANGERYYSNLYLTEYVVTSSQDLTFEEADPLFKELQKESAWKIACLYGAGLGAKLGEEMVSYGMTDLDALSNLDIVTKRGFAKNDVIISRSFAEHLGLSEGDRIELTAPAIYAHDANGVPLEIVVQPEQRESMRVAYIAEDGFLQANDILIDITREAFINESVWLERIYLDGDKEEIEQRLQELKGRYPTLKWTNYTDAIAINNEKIDSRYAVLNFVVKVMVLMALLGWINSLKNILISRTKDYDIIRMQGVRRSRIVKIMVYQILFYIFMGLIVGGAIGILLLELLMYEEQKQLIFQFNFRLVGQMLCMMMALCFLLIPTIRQLSSRRF